MKPSNVDLVFVLDTSGSMRPCFDALRANIAQLIKPLQGFSFNVRIGFVALHTGESASGGVAYYLRTLVGTDYADITRGAQGLFTSNADEFSGALSQLTIEGNEHQLLALDCALDFPFGPLALTKRVVAMYSDEPLEGGAFGSKDIVNVPALVQKMMARRIQLFAAMPASAGLDELAAADGAEIETVSGGDGLANVDFAKLLGQMAKSISVSSMQGAEAPYTRALFRQDQWVHISSASASGLR